MDVDHQVALQVGGDFGESVRAGHVRRFRHDRGPAKGAHRRRDALVVGRHHDGIDPAGFAGPKAHVLDHRAAIDLGERFAGEPCGLVSGGNKGDDASVAKRGREPWRENDGHGKS